MTAIRRSRKISSKDIVVRWGQRPAVFTDGFLAVPLVLLRNLSEVGEYGISPAELVFILELMTYKWDVDAPFPSYKLLADQMGVSEAYSRKLARSLEDKGLLTRLQRQGTTNEFDLAPLFRVLSDMGEEIEAEKSETPQYSDDPF